MPRSHSIPRTCRFLKWNFLSSLSSFDDTGYIWAFIQPDESDTIQELHSDPDNGSLGPHTRELFVIVNEESGILADSDPR